MNSNSTKSRSPCSPFSTSAQDMGWDFPKLPSESAASNLSDSAISKKTVKKSSPFASQESPSTKMCDTSAASAKTPQISSLPHHPANLSASREGEKVSPMSETAFLPSLERSRRDLAFGECATIRPRFFIIENVPGLLSSPLHRAAQERGAFLEKHFNIPIGWTFPQESRPAAQLLEDGARQLVIPWIGESQRSPLNESSTSIPSVTKRPVTRDCSSNEISPSKKSPSKKRRRKGEGSGCIYWCTVTRNSKEYPQYWYHYEIWSEGDRLVKSSKYIPKSKLAQVQQLEKQKAPVQEILKVLGVK